MPQSERHILHQKIFPKSVHSKSKKRTSDPPTSAPFQKSGPPSWSVRTFPQGRSASHLRNPSTKIWRQNLNISEVHRERVRPSVSSIFHQGLLKLVIVCRLVDENEQKGWE